ncbi:S-layer homology domain-containing protein [uncultured Brevibacillus sp.]|uniref:S-layer homology domain-containing protein n=1 Tax=uncultured Brevibacillus sp. TaxID=169970 RepID=UPI002599E925|nr:S-layer homology domain-containing protein [uncultured Brevibacillus sp.]
MKINRTLLTFSTFAVMALSIVQPSFAQTTPFTDLANVAAKDKIIALQQMGTIQGVEDHHFMPDATVTAAQGVQLIVKALDLNLDTIRFIKEPKATDYFSKADNNGWYANALIVAANNGFELPADLDPNQVWTKEEFIHQLMLAMERHGNLPMIKIVPVEFGDADQLTVQYQGTIQRSLVLGITALGADKLLHPKDAITRKEAAEIIYNAVEYLKAHPGPKAEEPSTQVQ